MAYTESWGRPAAAEPSITFRQWATENPAPTGSMPAHIAAKAVEDFASESAPAFHLRLMEAYFTENRTISDWRVLAELADEVDIDREEFLAVAEAQQMPFAERIIDEHNAAIEAGVTGVPTVLLDDVLPVPGAQDFNTYEIYISRLIDRRTAIG